MTCCELSDTDELLVQALLLEDAHAAGTAGRRFLAAVDLQLIAWSQARLLPALYRRMVALGEATPALMRGAYRRAWSQNQLRFRAVAATMTKLEAEGIVNVVLKGASLVPAYGGDWGVRDMSDVDVLVPLADVDRSAALLAADGWRPRLGCDVAGALARVVDRRHSWAFEHPDGHQLDLHWHVLQTSRGPGSDAAFFDRAEPLELGTVRARRLCDADLLLHLLEHAAHAEEGSKLQWVVDVVHLLRAVDDLPATAERLGDQARAHRLTGVVRDRLGIVADLLGEPRALALRDRCAERSDDGRRRLLDAYRRGDTRPLPAVAAFARERIDGRLARRRCAWAAYVLSGRRLTVERLLTARRGPLTGPASRTVPRRAADGWWDMWDPEVVDGLCGPGWWYPEPGLGVWSEGVESRLHVPVGPATAAIEVQLSLLGTHGGPPRSVTVRVSQRWRTVLHAEHGHCWHAVRVPVSAPVSGSVEVAFRVARPARPADLALSGDVRRLGVLLHRVRTCD